MTGACLISTIKEIKPKQDSKNGDM